MSAVRLCRMSCRVQVFGGSDGRAGSEGSGRGDTVRVCFCGRFTRHVCNKIRRCGSSTSLVLSLNSSAVSSKQLLGLLGLLIGCLLHRLEELDKLLIASLLGILNVD